MKLAIIVAPTFSAWSASEVLWSLTAHEALRQGHSVTISRRPVRPDPPQPLEALRQAGARILDQPDPGRIPNRLVGERMARSHYRALMATKPDVLLLNQGDTYGAVFRRGVRHLLQTTSAPYVVSGHSNYEDALLRPQDRQIARDYLQGAYRSSSRPTVTTPHRTAARVLIAKQRCHGESDPPGGLQHRPLAPRR